MMTPRLVSLFGNVGLAQGSQPERCIIRAVGRSACLLLAHRVIFALVNGRWPADEIDHENRNPSVNKIGNLREATRAENMQNTGRRTDNTSGAKGVHWDKRMGLWVARILDKRHSLWIGAYDKFEHAVAAREVAESVLHPFAPKPKPLSPAEIIPDGALVTGVYRFDTKPKRVTFTLAEAT
jgi:hypothetical protein